MKFSQPVCEAILKDIADEIPHEISCEANGVGYSTFKNWLSLGRIDQELGKETHYSRFLAAVRNVQRKKVKSHLNNIEETEKGHKGSEWILERAYWRYFSSKVGEIELNERVEKLENKKGEGDAEEKENVNG